MKLIVTCLLSLILTGMLQTRPGAEELERRADPGDPQLLAEDERATARRLAEAITKIQTYTAKFTQRVENEYGQILDQSSGDFTIERPNHFRWQTDLQTIVADGQYLWTWDKDLEQVTIQNQQETLANSPMLLLTSDEKDLLQSFSVTQLKTGSGAALFELKPSNDGSVFERVHLLMDGGKITELLFADALGQNTSITFSDIQLNQPVDAKLFVFDAPEGVDIIDSREYDH